MRAIIFIFIFSLSIISIHANTVGDFDGDGKTDITVVRNYNFFDVQQSWYSLNSGNNNNTFGYAEWGRNMNGNQADEPIIGDVDGDGKSDHISWRHNFSTNEQAYFWIMKSSDSSIEVIPWGLGRDKVVVQDYDGDGKDDLAVYRPNDGTFYVLKSSGGILIKHSALFGIPSPMVGDYDGDGKGDFTLTYSNDSTGFYRIYQIIRSSDDQVQTVQFGIFNDYPVVGDYDGDGTDDLAVWRGRDAINGEWYWLRSSDGQLGGVRLGRGTPEGDFPVPGDYDGDGITDPAIVRINSDLNFWILGSQSGLQVIKWGLGNDKAFLIRFL